MAFLLTTGMAHNVSDLVKHDYKGLEPCKIDSF